MKHTTILLGLLLALNGTAFAACTEEEVEKITWLKHKEAVAIRTETLIQQLEEKKAELDADIDGVKKGTWPLVKDVVADDI